VFVLDVCEGILCSLGAPLLEELLREDALVPSSRQDLVYFGLRSDLVNSGPTVDRGDETELKETRIMDTER